MEDAVLFGARGSRFEMANIIDTLGRMALQQGDMAKAHTTLKETVTLAKGFNYQIMVGRPQPFLGRVTLYRGDVVEARRRRRAPRLARAASKRHSFPDRRCR